MKTQDLRKLTIEELKDKIAELKKKLVEIEFNLKIGKESNYATISENKKEIAKIMTIINEKNIENIDSEIK